MSVLRGTNSDPTGFTDKMTRVDANKEGKQETVKKLSEELARWSAFQHTRTGQIAADLADPLIDHLELQLRQPVLSYLERGWPIDYVKEFLAECRGELRVWRLIKFHPKMLEDQLEELAQLDKDEEARKVDVPDVLKKYE